MRFQQGKFWLLWRLLAELSQATQTPLLLLCRRPTGFFQDGRSKTPHQSQEA